MTCAPHNARAMSLRTRAFAYGRAAPRLAGFATSIAIAVRSDTTQCALWGFVVAFAATGGLL